MSRLDDTISDVAYILDTLIAYRNIVDYFGDCNRCGKKKTCEYAPKPGQLVRYNCPFYKRGGRVVTLEEAIKHAEAVAQAKEREAKENRNHGGWAYDDEAKKCSACAAEHRQLAEWLKELKAVQDIIKQHDRDSMPEDYWYIDKIRTVVLE